MSIVKIEFKCAICRATFCEEIRPEPSAAYVAKWTEDVQPLAEIPIIRRSYLCAECASECARRASSPKRRPHRMGKGSEIVEDDRRIEAVHFLNDPDQGCWKVRDKQQEHPWFCDSIEAYGEPSMHGNIAWIKVIDGSEVLARLPAWAVEIRYERNAQ